MNKLLLLIPILTGCAATRTVSDVGLGASGAVLAHQLSGGSPGATAAGAAAGVLVSEGIHSVADKAKEKAWTTGYNQGRSDAVKQQYWLYVGSQKPREGSTRLYPIQVPEQEIDGVTFKATTKLLRIEEP